MNYWRLTAYGLLGGVWCWLIFRYTDFFERFMLDGATKRSTRPAARLRGVDAAIALLVVTLGLVALYRSLL